MFTLLTSAFLHTSVLQDLQGRRLPRLFRRSNVEVYPELGKSNTAVLLFARKAGCVLLRYSYHES
jgi:hypothetical protein